VYKFITYQADQLYDKYTPYSFKIVRNKVKDLGLEYSQTNNILCKFYFFPGQCFFYIILYFYNIVVSIVYSLIAVSIIPYITYLRYKRIYSEFIFEQIQVYTTNTIMEFMTTESFVKSLEGVYASGY
jgi:hypothetical protein